MTPEPDHRLSIAFQTDKAPGDYGPLAAAAESYGFGTVSVFGDLMFGPPVTALLPMAAATHRVRLGAAGMNPFTVHPVEIAGQVADLDAASGGRAYAGIVPGAWLDRIGLPHRSPADAVTDTVAIVRALLRGDPAGHDGRVFRIDPGVVPRYDVLRTDVPVLVGGWGPRVLAAAMAVGADEVKLGGTANPALVAVARDRLAAGRPASHSSPVSPREPGVVLGAVTVVDHDGDAARRRAKQEVSLYLPVVAGLDPTLDVDPDLLTRLAGLVDAGRSPEAGELVDDELLGLFAFAGTPADIARQAAAVLDAGAARVEFGTPHGLTDRQGVDLLGLEVLPRIRSELT